MPKSMGMFPLWAAAAVMGLTTAGPATAHAADGARLVVCEVTGTTTFAETGQPTHGLTLSPARDLAVTGGAAGGCVDGRLDRSATGGHAITGYTGVVRTGSALSDSTCALLNGTIMVDVTWALAGGGSATSAATFTLTAANILEEVPGTGSVTSGLFAGSAFMTASLHTSLDNALRCLTAEGVTTTSRASTITVTGT